MTTRSRLLVGHGMGCLPASFVRFASSRQSPAKKKVDTAEKRSADDFESFDYGNVSHP